MINPKMIFLLVQLWLVCGTIGNCQTFSDSLFLKSGDTTICEITLVNDNNIFYSIKKKNKNINRYIPLSEILRYHNNVSDTPVQMPDVKFCFDTTHNWIFGLRYSLQSIYPLINNGFSLSMYKANHNIFIGPEYLYLNRSFLVMDSFYKWENQYLGLNIGYRYIPNSQNQYLNLYFLSSYVVFQGEYTKYQLGPPFETTHKKLIFMNTGGFGLNYKPNRNLVTSVGIGLSSTNYFFLMLNEAFFNASVSIEYRFFRSGK